MTLKEKKDLKSITKTSILLNYKKEEQSKAKANRRKEIMTIRVEKNKTETRKTIERTEKLVLWRDQQNWQNSSYTDREIRKTQISEIMNESGDIITDLSEIIFKKS